MLVGFNYPWPANRYITIGPNIHERGKPQPWTQDQTMARNFEVLRNAGISVVRIWLMGDGKNYDGMVEFGFANNRGLFWDFHPPNKLHQLFLDDFEALLAICKSAQIQLIPVLLDFKFFDEPDRDNHYVRNHRPGIEPTSLDFGQGRRAIASNPEFRGRFIHGTLEPLLEIAAKKKEVIYAFEIVNEPWWCIAPITGSLFGRAMEKSDMTAFLLECCASVKKYKLPTTIGHRYLSDIYRTFSGVKVDHPQHHYYATSPFLDGLNAREASPRPAKILGEFGSITLREFEDLKRRTEKERNPERKKIMSRQVSDFELQKNPWPGLIPQDNDPANVLEIRLRYLEARGYELAMIWPGPVDPDRETTDDLKLDLSKLESVKKFTRGR